MRINRPDTMYTDQILRAWTAVSGSVMVPFTAIGAFHKANRHDQREIIT